MDLIAHRILRFDRFVLDLARGCLRAGDQEIRLRPKTFEVLCYLAQHAGRLVSKEELFEGLWPDVTVSDDSLVQCIRELRQKLGDDDRRLIKTVSRRGYLLDATILAQPLQPLPDGSPARPAEEPQKPATKLDVLHPAIRTIAAHKLLMWSAGAAGLMCVALGIIYPLRGWMVLWPRTRVAQSVEVGDAWVYDFKDATTGFPISTYTSLVTEVSPQEIVTRVIRPGMDGGIVVFDHDWNRLTNVNDKHNPHDGNGIRWPLAVGKEWRHQFTTSNLQTGNNMNASSLIKVAEQETVTTPAGTFETFKINHQTKAFNVKDPSISLDIEMLMWFAPQINHWIRRTYIVKREERTISRTTDELIEIMKKQ